MTMPSLAVRIGRLEDLQAIRSLSTRYALAVDARDYAALGDLFTADATFGGTSDGAPGVSGSEPIVAFLRERLEAGGATYHSVHDVAVTIDPEGNDSASGIVTAHAETRQGQQTIIKAVRYTDDYRRSDCGWRFQRRLLSFPMT